MISYGALVRCNLTQILVTLKRNPNRLLGDICLCMHRLASFALIILGFSKFSKLKIVLKNIFFLHFTTKKHAIIYYSLLPFI